MKSIYLLTTFFFCFGIGSSTVTAATPIINIPNPGLFSGGHPIFNEGHGNGMVGWEFEINVTMLVTSGAGMMKAATGFHGRIKSVCGGGVT